MIRRHKLVSSCICFALVLGALFTWRFAHRERRLLDFATTVDIPIKEFPTSSDEWEESRMWLSDHEIAICQTLWGSQSRKMLVTRQDVNTGAHKTVSVPFTEITEETHSDAALSPDGKWVLWHDDYGVYAGEIATGKRIGWDPAGDTMHLKDYWLSDSRHWLQFTTAPSYVILHNVDNPDQDMRMTFPKSGPMDTKFNYSDAFITKAGHIIVTLDQFDVTGMRPGVTITEYVMQAQVGRVAQTARHFIPASSEYALRGSAISPDGDRIAWSLFDSTEGSFTRILRKAIPNLVRAPRCRVKLCTSRLDGTDRREIGLLDSGSSADDVSQPGDMVWLPGGKRISFLFMNDLYTVPAE